MKHLRIRQLILPVSLFLVFGWVVYGFYQQWDARQFAGDLERNSPRLPEDKNAPQTTGEQTVERTSAPQNDDPALKQHPSEIVAAEEVHTPIEDVEDVETRQETSTTHPQDHTHGHSHDQTSDHSHDPNESTTEAASTEGTTDKKTLIKRGFQDYHTYIDSDPERAYQRLREALVYKHGERGDIDTLVSFVRKSNTGPLTVDEAMLLNDTLGRLRGGAAVLARQNAQLRMMKEAAMEHGVPPEEMLVEYKFDFVGMRH